MARILARHQELMAAAEEARGRMLRFEDRLNIARAEYLGWREVEELEARHIEAGHTWRRTCRALAAFRMRFFRVVYAGQEYGGHAATIEGVFAPVVEAARQLAAFETRHYALHPGHVDVCLVCRRERRRLRALQRGALAHAMRCVALTPDGLVAERRYWPAA